MAEAGWLRPAASVSADFAAESAAPSWRAATAGDAWRYRLMHDVNAVIETDIPARLDRLPWSRFHTLVVAALGITWILDGLEVTLAGSIAGALEQSPVLHFGEREVGLVATAYLVGAVLGALLFG